LSGEHLHADWHVKSAIWCHVLEDNLLRQTVVSDFQDIENVHHLQDQFRSPPGLFSYVLEVHCMTDKESHFHLIHVLNLFNNHTVLWIPKVGI